MKKVLSAFLAAALLLCFAACSQPAPETSDKWCVMTYMDFSDLFVDETKNLFYGIKNLDEVCASAPNENVKAYFLTGGASKPIDISKTEKLQYVIEPIDKTDPFGKSAQADSYQLWEYTSDGKFVERTSAIKGMNNSGVLSQFMEQCYRMAKEAYPDAKYKYILEMWDHGDGSYVGLVKDKAIQAQSAEAEIMSLADCANAVKSVTNKNGFKFEVVIFDMCLMQSVETMHAISYDAANYVIGSQTSASVVGSAYTDWFNFLYRNPKASGREFGEDFCESAYAKVEKYALEVFKDNITWSVFDMSQLAAVESAYEEYAASELKSISASEVEGCLKKIDSILAFNPNLFWAYYMYDINVFTGNIGSSEAASALMRAVNSAVVCKKYGKIQEDAGACGLSMCILTDTNGWDTELKYSKEWNNAYLANCLTPEYRTFQKRIASGLQ